MLREQYAYSNFFDEKTTVSKTTDPSIFSLTVVTDLGRSRLVKTSSSWIELSTSFAHLPSWIKSNFIRNDSQKLVSNWWLIRFLCDEIFHFVGAPIKIKSPFNCIRDKMPGYHRDVFRHPTLLKCF